jgi:chemotaxis protein MotA
MLDLAAIVGTLLGLGAVLVGQILEGGTLGQITQITAALIVLGGTLGAMLLSFSSQDVAHAFKSIPLVYLDSRPHLLPLIDEIFELATIARKEGVLALEAQKSKMTDPLLRRGIQFVVDGFDPATVREILEAEIDRTRSHDEMAGRVFEAAGGYAPTVGILGAVLGLIHVMAMLSEPAKIGEGIAVAFVATVYGVGLANLVLIPWGSKLKRRAQLQAQAREMVMVGILGIQEGLNPSFLREKLLVYQK